MSRFSKKFSFAALNETDSDQESECVASARKWYMPSSAAGTMFPEEFPEGVLWGDHEYVDEGPSKVAPPVAAPPASEEEQRLTLFRQPFAADLEEYPNDDLNTREMSDASWEALMTYLYAHGWLVEYADRNQIEAYPDNLPPRIWTRPYEEDEKDRAQRRARDSQPPVAAKAAKAPVAAKAAKAAPKQIPRFCQGCKGERAACRYVHEDTIQKIDSPCAFGAACGASDPTGLKRSQCIYIHAECGEIWSPESVIHRPPPAPETVA